MSELLITTPIPPSVNNYLNYRVQKNPHNGRLFVQPYKSQDSIAYEGKVIKYTQRAIKDQKWELPGPTKYVIVDAVFYWPKHGMDTNNHWKLPLDCFKAAGVYHDDSKVLEGARRSYIDANNPRIVFRIYQSGFLGIFDSEEHYRDFIADNCDNCRKNPNRCSIVTKALENRLTGDIILEYNKCNKLTKK